METKKMETKKVNLEDISRDIASYIDNKVAYIRYDDNKWKSGYEDGVDEIESEIARTRELIKDYSDEKLTINSIEAEGYLRGLITMLNIFKQVMPND